MDALSRLAARQGGLFTRAQARSCGYSAYQVRHRMSTGEWHAVLGPVLATRGIRVTVSVRDRAAALAVPGAVLAGASAARLYGIEVPDSRTYLWIGRRRRPALSGVAYLPDPLAVRDVCLYAGMRVTSPNRTIFDCLRFLDDRAAVRLLDRAQQAGWITRAELVRHVRGFVGRHGAPRLVRFAQMVGSGAQSAAERLAIELLRKAGVTGWRVNHPIFDGNWLIGIGDLVFPQARLVVEIDGWAYHSSPERFQHDRQRQNRLVGAGWTVLRFTWRDLTERPDHVVTTIRTMGTRAA